MMDWAGQLILTVIVMHNIISCDMINKCCSSENVCAAGSMVLMNKS